MNYKESIAYLYSQLPMFQRIGKAAYKANLDNTIALCRLLNNPEKKIKGIHIAGTNGKGSVAHMLASILQEAGYKTGLYTSPHLKDFRERIKINGHIISEAYTTDFVNKYYKDFEVIKPSFFEMTVGLAFDYFAASDVDLAVVEVGMGGRLDSTNVLDPLVSVITNISYDHTSFLGNTLEKIAFEKAGIIKKHTPVVIGQTQNLIKPIFIEKAQGLNAPIYFADTFYTACFKQNILSSQKMSQILVTNLNKQHKKYFDIPLGGTYQKHNLVTALKTIDVLKDAAYTITENHIKSGIRNVVNNTGFLGRWQMLSEKPLAIADTAHNAAGLEAVWTQLQSINAKQIHIVLGLVDDKEVDKILALFPKNAIYYFCKPDIPRGLDTQILKNRALGLKLYGNIFTSAKEAYHSALAHAADDDLIFVGGSTFVVAEVV